MISAYNERKDCTMEFQFPRCIKYANEPNQIQKILSEVDEFIEAEGKHKIVECLDVIAACETWLHNNATTSELDNAHGEVIRKNARRGYYGQLGVQLFGDDAE